MAMTKPRVAVHKFSSCDGCQLAFLNAGEALLELSGLVEIAHFLEAGPSDAEAKVDIAFVEGSISTPDERARIQTVRRNAKYLVTIGACATSGGIQALRNLYADSVGDWAQAIYAQPEVIESLEEAAAIRDHVRVDLELWGCPITTQQVLAAVRSLLFGVPVAVNHEPVCMSCKRRGNVCTLVSQGEPCLGPVTQTGCGAICPAFGRACYGCFGPRADANTQGLSHCFAGLGLSQNAVRRRFHFITSTAEPFRSEGEQS